MTAGIRDFAGHPIADVYESLNTRWHRAALLSFLGIVLFHWLEHLIQAYQVLRDALTGTSHTWWMVAFWVQFWHHFEYFILFYQAQTQQFWFGGTVPTSVGQIWISRIELHLIYNALVFIPMVAAMYYHMYPPALDTVKAMCTCARHRASAAAPPKLLKLA